MLKGNFEPVAKIHLEKLQSARGQSAYFQWEEAESAERVEVGLKQEKRVNSGGCIETLPRTLRELQRWQFDENLTTFPHDGKDQRTTPKTLL